MEQGCGTWYARILPNANVHQGYKVLERSREESSRTLLLFIPSFHRDTNASLRSWS